ncbi:MAG: hypothetical protein IJC99_02920 [Clostridia bacterium]|nr:hypothetical protein [Clostridia bacterium]
MKFDVRADAAFREKRRKMGENLHCNSIACDYRAVIAGGHSDDRAMQGDLAGSWGWIADRGFHLMQTDFVLESRLFLEETGRRMKKPC